MIEHIYTREEIRVIVRELAQRYGVERFSLFGSYSRGDARLDSDIDLRIDKGRIKGLLQLSDFHLDLEEKFNTHVDVLIIYFMNSTKRSIDILEHIIKYCNEIFGTTKCFGYTFEVFKTNTIYRNAVAMCILQIGELSGHLSDSFKEVYNGVPWRNIKGMRNIMVH